MKLHTRIEKSQDRVCVSWFKPFLSQTCDLPISVGICPLELDLMSASTSCLPSPSSTLAMFVDHPLTALTNLAILSMLWAPPSSTPLLTSTPAMFCLNGPRASRTLCTLSGVNPPANMTFTLGSRENRARTCCKSTRCPVPPAPASSRGDCGNPELIGLVHSVRTCG